MSVGNDEIVVRVLRHPDMYDLATETLLEPAFPAVQLAEDRLSVYRRGLLSTEELEACGRMLERGIHPATGTAYIARMGACSRVEAVRNAGQPHAFDVREDVLAEQPQGGQAHAITGLFDAHPSKGKARKHRYALLQAFSYIAELSNL